MWVSFLPFIVRVPRAGGRPGYPSHPSEAARCMSTGDNLVRPLLSLPLLDDHFNAAVLGTPGFRVVAGDRVAIPVACGREVVTHPAVTQ